jgi:hypothetical protein
MKFCSSHFSLLSMMAILVSRQHANGQQRLAIGGGITTTAQDLSSICPAEFARLSPCVESSEALSECVACVTEWVLTAEATAFNTTTTMDASVAKSGETTMEEGGGEEQGGEASTVAPYSCENVQQDVCTTIATCGDVCGLVNKETVLTFGRDCEDLFLNMVGCALADQGSVTIAEQKCAIEGACNGAEDAEEEAEKEEEDKYRDGALSRLGYSAALTLPAAVAVASLAV